MNYYLCTSQQKTNLKINIYNIKRISQNQITLQRLPASLNETIRIRICISRNDKKYLRKRLDYINRHVFSLTRRFEARSRDWLILNKRWLQIQSMDVTFFVKCFCNKSASLKHQEDVPGSSVTINLWGPLLLCFKLRENCF